MIISSDNQWLTALGALWPGIAVWFVIALPTLAANHRNVRRSIVELDLGRTLAALVWFVEHCWPYSRICRWWDALEDAEQRWHQVEQDRKCRVCGQTMVHGSWSIDHLLRHFPDEPDWDELWWSPPPFTNPDQALEWLEARSVPEETENVAELIAQATSLADDLDALTVAYQELGSEEEF